MNYIPYMSPKIITFVAVLCILLVGTQSNFPCISWITQQFTRVLSIVLPYLPDMVLFPPTQWKVCLCLIKNKTLFVDWSDQIQFSCHSVDISEWIRLQHSVFYWCPEILDLLQIMDQNSYQNNEMLALLLVHSYSFHEIILSSLVSHIIENKPNYVPVNRLCKV